MKQVKYPQLFVFREKHGDHYVMVDSKEDEEKMFLKILKERNDDGWYSWMKDHKPYGEAPKYTKEEIDKMPDSMESLKKKLLFEYNKWERLEKEASLIRSDWNKIQKAINNNDGKMAHYLIDSNSDDEYSGYERVWFEHIV